MALPLSETPPSPVTVRAVRRFQGAARRGPGTRQRVEAIYIAVLVTLIAGTFVYNTAHSALAQVISALEVARWGPALALLALLAAAYWGTVQGPVVFSVADLGHLVAGSPLPRRALVASPLARALAGAALAGALAAGIVVAGLTGDGHAVRLPRAADLVAGVALLGILSAVAAFAVAMDRRCERALRLLTVPALAAAGALALAGALAGPTGREIDVWSGPWGWALQAGAGFRTAWYVGATAALATLVAIATAIAWRRRGSGETERYARRSQGLARLQASLMDLNARTARRDLAAVAGRPRAGRARDLRRLRRLLARSRSDSAPARGGAHAVIWRDVLAAVQRPVVIVQVLAIAIAGSALALLDAGRVVGVAAGGVLIYVAASRLLEPLRIENDVPARSRLFLAARPGRAYLAHTIVPAAFILTALAATTAGLALAGALAGYGAAAAIDLILAGPALVGCAAMSARRGGRLPQDVLMTAMSTDPSGGGLVLLGWLLMWPAAAAVLVALPLGGARAGHGASPVLAVVELIVAAVLARALARD